MKEERLSKKPLPKLAIDLSGQQFGRLEVVRFAGTHDKSCYWHCLCVCGNKTICKSHALRSGASKSCGCLRKERAAVATSLARKTHGKTVGGNHKIYRIWINMMSRCYNKNVRSYPSYGGRGITVCEKWKHFQGFFDDMGECPKGMTLDRVNNELGYSKDNCEWKSAKDQANNRRSNRFLEIRGERKTVAEWSLVDGANRASAIYYRLKRGWTDADAVFKKKPWRDE